MAVVGVAVFGCFVFVLSLNVVVGDYVVLRSPKYVNFLPDAQPIDTVEIAPLIAASFGLPLNQDLKWNGLAEMSLFQRPKASVVISVTGVSDGRLDSIVNVARYKTVETENGLNTDDLTEHVESIDWQADPLIVDFAADGNMFNVRSGRSDDLFASLPSTLGALGEDVTSGVAPRWFSAADLASLNASSDVDLRFAGELYVIREIVTALLEQKSNVKTKSPDFFHFHVAGLELLAQTYGRDSVQFGDALLLLKATLDHVSDQLVELYSGNVVVQLVTFGPEAAAKPNSARHGRSLLALDPTGLPPSPGTVTRASLNLAPVFSRSYSAIFNICLWTMIAFGLTIFFVSWGIWNMDPGRDSIIYRMTSTRMKRD